MLKFATSCALFAAFLIVAIFLGLVLWQALFSSANQIDTRAKLHSEQTGTDNSKEKLNKGDLPQSTSSPTEEAIAIYTKWLAIFTALLVIATIALFVSGERNVEVAEKSANAAVESARIANDAVNSTRNQILLMFPPHMKVNQFHIWEDGHGEPFDPDNRAPRLKSGTRIWGSVTIVNDGKDLALIDSADCLLFWHGGTLPMISPLASKTRVTRNKIRSLVGREIAEEIDEMRPGKLGAWLFDGTVPDNFETETKSLYILGFVVFRDTLNGQGTRRAKLFARRYDPDIGNFVPVDNPTYETEE